MGEVYVYLPVDFGETTLGSVLSKFGGFCFSFWDYKLFIIIKIYDSPITNIIIA